MFGLGGGLGGCGEAGSAAYVLRDTCPVLLDIALIFHTGLDALT